MGCYIVSNNTLTIEGVVADIRRRSRGDELLVASDLNAD